MVALATAVPSVVVGVFLTGLAGGFAGCFVACLDFAPAGFAASVAFAAVDGPISRSAATGVTIPVRNITSWVPILIADDTTI